MAMVCDICGAEAGYLMYVQVEVLALGGGKTRKKGITLRLCEEHETANQHFLQRDAGQARRVAEGMCPQWKREVVWDHWRKSDMDGQDGQDRGICCG